ITSLEIANLRIVEQLDLSPGPGLNFIQGPNGAGKTSILEAIYLAGRGRTFRHSDAGPLIRRGAEAASVVVQFSGENGASLSRLGVRRDKSSLTCRLNGKDIKKRSTLAETLPLQWMGSQPQLLLGLGPEVRRRFIDLALFHVEPTYLNVITTFQRALRQRNAALRRGPAAAVRHWHEPMDSAAAVMDSHRAAFIASLLPRVRNFLERWSVEFELGWRYRRGWGQDIALKDLLQQKLDQDLRIGYTSAGPQRAELDLIADGASAEKSLSRGQQKLLVLALNLGVMDMIIEAKGVAPVLLVDDLAAELDSENRARLIAELEQRDVQIFLTRIERRVLAPNKPSTVFHVEHGRLVVGD
ncbi:MAG: DNA replication/repair protein RecF, partial [Chromatiaceae bacterium]